MSNMEKAKTDAETKAQIDFAKGKHAAVTRHNARDGSAWATWYLAEYKRLQNKVHEKQFENILKRFA